MHCNLQSNIEKQFQYQGFIKTLLIIIKVFLFYVSFRIYIYITCFLFYHYRSMLYQNLFWHSLISFVELVWICFWNEVFKIFSGSYCSKMKMERYMSKRVIFLWWYIMALQLCFTFGTSEHISLRFSIFPNLSFLIAIFA